MSIWKRVFGATIALLLAIECAGIALPACALAESDSSASDLQDEVERTAQEYNDAEAAVEELNQEIADNEAKIEELEAKLPDQIDATSAAIATHYKLQQESPNIVTLLLSADNFNDFITAITYLDVISTKSVDDLQKLQDMQAELDEAKEDLAKQKEEADKKLQEAEDALAEAQAARIEAQADAEAQAAAEAAEAAAAIQAASNSNTSTDTSTSTTDSDVDWSSDKASFVAQWTPRIDSFLAGSPMAGHGATFAEAAWDYGVDPRWSPAIAAVESSRGASCFLPYNAWGWGSESWSNWDSAIRDHVAGLASGYGYTVSVSAAQKYCPSNWQFWYSRCLALMESI